MTSPAEDRTAAPRPPGREPNLPALAGGALLLLIAVGGERWPAAGALAFGLAILPFRFLIGIPVWIVLPAAALLGGMLGAAVGATEVAPPVATPAKVMNLLLRTFAEGALQAVWVGGGLFLLWRALHRPRRGEPPRDTRLDRVLRALRPLRLALLLLVVAFTPSLRPGREVRALRLTLQSDLARLAYHQARYFETHGHFIDRPESVPAFAASDSVNLVIQVVDSTRWRARVLHPRLTTACYITASARAGRTLEPSDPVCRERKRWF
jgi:hypothetical protein